MKKDEVKEIVENFSAQIPVMGSLIAVLVGLNSIIIGIIWFFRTGAIFEKNPDIGFLAFAAEVKFFPITFVGLIGLVGLYLIYGRPKVLDRL